MCVGECVSVVVNVCERRCLPLAMAEREPIL